MQTQLVPSSVKTAPKYAAECKHIFPNKWRNKKLSCLLCLPIRTSTYQASGYMVATTHCVNWCLVNKESLTIWGGGAFMVYNDIEDDWTQ